MLTTMFEGDVSTAGPSGTTTTATSDNSNNPPPPVDDYSSILG